MLDYWCEFKISTVDKKSCFFYQTWYDAGITKRSDILNQNQDFLKWHEFAIKFNLNVPFTTYYGLVNAIPKKWKANLTNPVPNVTHDTTVNSLKNQFYLLLSLKVAEHSFSARFC